MLAPQRLNPTVSIPSWASSGDQTVYVQSPLMTPLPESDSDLESDLDTELYLSDYFRMYEFKVRKCMRARSHDWTECPFAHPGEKAMRRDPRKYAYSGIACPEFRKGNCVKGDACEYAHGVFECWLHPSRYRTQPCKDGLDCQRRVCFFAHTAEELRVITPKGFIRPASPVNKVVRSMRNLQLGRMNSLPCVSRGVFRGPGFMSLPSTPTQGVGGFGSSTVSLEEPVMKRVESGRDLRIQMMERIKKESCLGLIADEGSSGDKGEDPDLDWVSKLLQ